MHWQDTVIKSSDIKWRRPKVGSTDDGKLDLDIHLPLTDLFRGQAKRSFAAGVFATLLFHTKAQETDHVIEREDLVTFFNECGLPELAKRLTAAEGE